MIIAWDPGRKGAVVAMSSAGEILYTAEMPVDGAGICPIGVARVYTDLAAIVPWGETPTVVIEKIFTRPTDAVSVEMVKAGHKLAESVSQLLVAVDGGYTTQDHYEALRGDFEAYTPHLGHIPRADGRVGNLNYAKGAGMLFMGAVWGWPIQEVSPRTWQARMFVGIDQKLPAKEKSMVVAKRSWPDLWDKDHEHTVRPGKKKKAHDGLVDALLMAEWARRALAKTPAGDATARGA